MKAVRREEWDKAPEEYKKVYDDTMYMVYKEEDGSVCFGPVRIIEEGYKVTGESDHGERIPYIL